MIVAGMRRLFRGTSKNGRDRLHCFIFRVENSHRDRQKAELDITMRVPVYDLFCEGHIRRSSQSGPAKHEVKCGCQRIGTDGVSCSRQKPSRLAPRSIARYVVIRYLPPQFCELTARVLKAHSLPGRITGTPEPPNSGWLRVVARPPTAFEAKRHEENRRRLAGFPVPGRRVLRANRNRKAERQPSR